MEEIDAKKYVELQRIMGQNPYLFEGLCVKNEVAFREWLPRNMHIYIWFVGFATAMKVTRDRDYYSARMIWERIRWETMLREKPEKEHKLSNNHAPFMAWLVMEAEPELAGMFQKKRRL